MEREVSMPLGIVVEKREVDHKWVDVSWRPVAIIPGADPVPEWREIESGDGWTRYHAATVPLNLYFSDTDAYLFNLSDRVPSVYIILRDEEDDDSDWPVFVHLATVSPFESEQFEDAGEDTIERVPMTPEMIAWLKAFIAFHHDEEDFVKRKRKTVKIEELKFGKEPIFDKAMPDQLTSGQIKDSKDGY